MDRAVLLSYTTDPLSLCTPILIQDIAKFIFSSKHCKDYKLKTSKHFKFATVLCTCGIAKCKIIITLLYKTCRNSKAAIRYKTAAIYTHKNIKGGWVLGGAEGFKQYTSF